MTVLIHKPLVALLLIVASASAEPTVLVGEVVGVSDGDTLTLLVDEDEIRIRLASIDAPESGQPFGTQAKKALSETVFGRVVRVTVTDTDRYKRRIGLVEIADGRGRLHNVNLALVRAGFAWHYTAYSDDAALAEAETEAREKRQGLWADSEPIAPWDWRKGERQRHKDR